jgi:hypothetical protein
MKIRTGFVSNSSSTSFSIYGLFMESSTILELVKQTTGREFKTIYDLYGDNVGGLSRYACDGYAYLGAEWSSIGDDETGVQFRERIKNTLVRVLGDSVTGKIQTHTDYISS